MTKSIHIGNDEVIYGGKHHKHNEENELYDTDSMFDGTGGFAFSKPIYDPVRYFLPLNHNRYADSTVVGMTGPKRSGKSLFLARLCVRDMLAGRRVWSNISVHTPQWLVKKGFPYLETEPIDWNGLYLLDEVYQEGTIALDESVYYDDSRSSLTTRNKLMNTIMNQVGHRSLNVYYTVKSQGWLDRRLQFETDVEVQCLDVAKTRFGRINHINPGWFIHLIAIDKSGAITGRHYDPKAWYRSIVANWTWRGGDHYWDSYDTREIIGLEELYTGVKIDMKQRVISNKDSVNEETSRILYDLINQARSAGDRIECKNYWDTVASMGVNGNPRQLGKYLKQFGIESKQAGDGTRYYDLTNLKLDK